MRRLDPLALALGLCALVLVAGGFTASFEAAAVAWVRGFAGLFTFAMQMTLMLVCGHVVASAPPVAHRLARLGAWIAERRRPLTWLVLITALLTWLHWGLGLVAGALLVRAVGREPVDLRAAAIYGAFVVWHGGLSGSAPLVVATPGHFLADRMGVLPLTTTIFAPLNLLLLFGVLGALLLWAWRLGGREASPAVLSEPPTAAVVERGVGKWFALGLGLVAILAWRGGALRFDLNGVILVLFLLGLLLHGTLAGFETAVREGAGAAAGILVQFPLYGGIMGVMRETGLAQVLAEALVAGVPTWGFYAAVLLSAGLVNLVVPSGGGQWAVQGPIVVAAARELHLPLAPAVLFFAWGDAWTNLIQPFWALPILAVTGATAGALLRRGVVLALWVGVPLLSVALAWGILVAGS